MKLLANENFPLDSVYLLPRWGYDVYSIGLDNPSISDEEVMSIAIKEQRIIMTFDRDYGELIFKAGYRPPEGVIYLRIEPVFPEYPAEIIRQLIESGDFSFGNCLTVLDETRIRQRQY